METHVAGQEESGCEKFDTIWSINELYVTDIDFDFIQSNFKKIPRSYQYFKVDALSQPSKITLNPKEGRAEKICKCNAPVGPQESNPEPLPC